MIITCDECSVRFNLDEKFLKPTGSKVRCSKCKNIFTAFPPEPQAVHDTTNKDSDFSLPEIEDEQKLDISDLEKMLQTDVDGEDEDFAFDDEPPEAVESDKIDSDKPSYSSEPEELDLELDFDEPSDTAESEELEPEGLETDTGETSDASEPEELDLELDIDEPPDTAEPKELNLDADEPSEVEELESEGLEIDTDEAADTAEPGEISLLDDIELDLAADEPSEAVESEELELDADESEELKLDADESEELKLDNDDEFEDDADEGDDLEDLEDMLDVDTDIKDEAGDESEDLDSEESEEIDLLDLEKTLEMDLDDDAEDDDDLDDLDMELELADETGDEEMMTDSSQEDDDLDIDSDEDLDMSDIEEMLEMDDDADAKDTGSSDDGELELEFVSDSGKIRDLDSPEEGDIELEFEEQAAQEEAVPDEEQEAVEILGQKTKEDDVPSEEKAKPSKKTGAGKIILVLFILMVMAGLVFVAVVLLDARGIKIPQVSPLIQDIKIPYLSDIVKPEVKDPHGNLKLYANIDINHKFIENKMTGSLFVITGKVKNEYDVPRSYINLRGKINSKGKNVETSKEQFAGNILSDYELRNLDTDIIFKRMQNKFGDNRQNLNIVPGKVTPFMIVFFNVPDTMDEYTAEIVGSSGKQIIDQALIEEEKSYMVPTQKKAPDQNPGEQQKADENKPESEETPHEPKTDEAQPQNQPGSRPNLNNR